MRVSLGLPVYNGERFLKEAIESIVAQSFEEFELLISDNASMDGTAELCRAYAREDRRIRYERAERNHGCAWNHNRVLELATGQYFKWCAADDVLGLDFVRKCVERLDRASEAVLCYSGTTTVIDEWGKEIAIAEDETHVDSRDPVVRFASLLGPLRHNVFYGLIRAELLRRSRPMGAYLAADRCLVAELSLLGPFAKIGEKLFFRRMHDHNLRRSAKEELEIYDPSMLRRVPIREWRVAREHLSTVWRAPVTSGTRVRLVGTVLRWMLSQRRYLLSELTEIGKYWVLAVSTAGGASACRD